MKLNLLKNKKDQFQEDVFEIVDSQFKKAFRVIQGNEVKSIEVSFEEDSLSNMYFSETSGFLLKNANEEIILFENTSEAIQKYIKESFPILDFFCKNYPLDCDDSVLIKDANLTYSIRHKEKQKQLKI